MPELIVIAGCTERRGMLDEYERQLAAVDIPFFLEALEPLPAGANSITMARRIAYVRKMARQFAAYRKIVITDAWDVLFFGSASEVAAKIPEGILVSAERNCYPEGDLGDKIQGTTPWRYANPGMIAGTSNSLLEWAAQAEQTADQNILDQAWFNRRRAEGSPLVPLDETTKLFYVVSANLEAGELQMEEGRPWNGLCETFPNFFHFSGGCPTDGFRKMLEAQ
jgi:hypothetical protein